MPGGRRAVFEGLAVVVSQRSAGAVTLYVERVERPFILLLRRP
jgi:hypothetical protein